MKKSKQTKKTIILSLSAIALSILMLIGTTFAWFTDTATSGKNKIIAGNLDVELYHSNATVQKSLVDNDTQLFDVALWEPGVVAYENFEITNIGELSLSYNFTMAIGDFNTVKDTEKSLKDVLKVALIEDGEFTGTREDLKTITFDKSLADFEKMGTLNIKDDTDKFAIIIYWEPSDNDNDYNLNNGKTSSDSSALYIDLGINLVASQSPYETDSFGSDYDDNTTYKEVSNQNEFNSRIYYAKKGEGVKLTADIDWPYAIQQSQSGTTIIDLNGHTLNAVGSEISEGNTMVIKNGKLNVTGKQITSATFTANKGSTLILENVEYSSSQAAGIYPIGEGTTVNIINSTITTYGHAISTNANSVENHNPTINIKNSTINGNNDGAGSAILINVPATVKIEDSHINGYLHGIIMRGGTATIKNSVITNKTDVPTTETYKNKFDTIEWGSGSNVTAAALTIGNKTSVHYKYPTDVTLINTKIISGGIDGNTEYLPTVYMIGNEEEGMGATLRYDSKSVTGEIVRGNDHVTVETIE